MKQKNRNSDLFRKRLAVGFALLFCLFFSSLEYLNESIQDSAIEMQEQGTENENQTFVSVAVDAVVPFALHITQTAFRLIYELVESENQLIETIIQPVGFTSSLGELFFERVISPQGP